MLTKLKSRIHNFLFEHGRIGNKIEDTVKIGKNTQIYGSQLSGNVTININSSIQDSILGGNYIEINANSSIQDSILGGKHIEINETAYIKDSTLLGDYIKIGKKCKLYNANLTGNIEVGDFTSLWGPNLNIASAINKVFIGNFCSIARNVVIQEYNHNYQSFTTYFIEQNLLKSEYHNKEIVSKGNIIIENDVWIGANAVILSGSHISTGAIVAAGSVVNGFVPPYAIVGGTPTKIIKYRFEEPIIKELLTTEWWTWDEKKIKDNINDLYKIVNIDRNKFQ